MGDEVARGQRGQASVELVAVVPLLVLAGAVVVQVGLAAHAWGAAREAARAGARAAQVDAPVRAAVARMMGDDFARGAAVRTLTGRDGEARVTVRVRVPMILPWVPAPSVAAEAPVGR